METAADFLVVGAGIAGLIAARQLAKRDDARVLVLEKSRGLGGRMASRRNGEAVFDHGAQYFTVRESRFQEWVDQWLASGAVECWFNGQGEGADHPRYVGRPSMTGVAKALARDLPVERGVEIESACCEDGRWVLRAQSGVRYAAPEVLFTLPVPQVMALLDAGKVALGEADDHFLRSIRYAKSLAALAVLDGPSGLAAPGALKLDPPEPVSWIADNQQKGVSSVPCLTVHSGPEFAEEYFDASDEARVPRLMSAVLPLLQSRVVSIQVHRWRYALRLTEHDRQFFADESKGLWLAGDGFHAPRVEGAALSGLAAADAMAQA